jgi:hypothetical protein
MTLFAVTHQDLARGEEANMLVAICKTEKIAERIKREMEEEAIEDGSRIDGVTIFIEEIEYLDK